jgi:hypothetical protein
MGYPLRITKKSVDLSLIHPRFKDRLENFFMDPRVKDHVAISSGCRSYAEQKRLYDKYRAGKGNLAANPDWLRPDGFFRGSFHQEQPDGYSYAVDLHALGGVSKPKITEVAADYGIRPTVKGEWWHFQPRDGNDWFRQDAFKENYTTGDGHTPHPEAVPMDWAALIALHTAITKSVGLTPLVRGSRGVEVKVLQKRLNALDFWCGTADGKFGWKTRAAVKRFQRTVLMPVNGQVGAVTWHRMWNPEIPDGL